MKQLFLILTVFFLFNVVAQSQVSVIVNKNVPEKNLEASKVANIYTLTTKKWSNGSEIKIADNSSAAKTKFFGFINKAEGALKKDWLKAKLSEGADVPKTFGSDAEVLDFVASTPGAVGFVSSSSVTDKVVEAAKIP